MQIETLNLHGYTVTNAMFRFVERYNSLLSGTPEGEFRALEVIHGKGKVDAGSIIRDTLRSYLREQGKRISGWDAKLAMRGADYLFSNCGNLAYIHGEDTTGNGGSTMVIPRQRLRPQRDWYGY